MKSVIILADGMADEPITFLDGKTPLQYARTPYMDKLASLGVTGLLKTITDGFPPGSEVANLSVLGYDIPTVYEGRGVLEAAGMGVELHPGEIALRCNLVCIKEKILSNFSAGHISDKEAFSLIKALNENLNSDLVHFYAGMSYRHLLILHEGNKQLICTPPHEILGKEYHRYLIKAATSEAKSTADFLNHLILKSQEILYKHPVNIKRMAEGKEAANSIWLWSPGKRPAMPTLKEMYGIENGSVISAVDLIKGIGIYAGLRSIPVKGATGSYDTDYEGKAKAALEAIKHDEFVYLHIEAPDEAGHEKDVALKIRTIEDIDKHIVAPIYESLKRQEEPVAIAILPDHPTPCATGLHSSSPVPFLIYKPGVKPDKVCSFDEKSVKEGRFGLLEGAQFIKKVLE